MKLLDPAPSCRVDSLIKQICNDYAIGRTTLQQYMAAIQAYRYVNNLKGKEA